ncbi:hypothetical protein Q8A67_014866 [Cirrhinus molitorella]|uniref:Uncharacterized protein n=1 Tax=Cirrhinus molitorella TaxID=172907 RepID=A0AA88PMC0_9TELE|nr:hypothetical protein Q8A67_014866 [Cirrhinus molitorella]
MLKRRAENIGLFSLVFALSTLTLSTSSPYFHTKPVQNPLKQDETEQTLHFNIVTHGVNHNRREINRGRALQSPFILQTFTVSISLSLTILFCEDLFLPDCKVYTWLFK